MSRFRYRLVRLMDATVESLEYIGPTSGLPAGWSIHKRSAAL
ncbi:hypothetical protein [Dyella marensis]